MGGKGGSEILYCNGSGESRVEGSVFFFQKVGKFGAGVWSDERVRTS